MWWKLLVLMLLSFVVFGLSAVMVGEEPQRRITEPFPAAAAQPFQDCGPVSNRRVEGIAFSPAAGGVMIEALVSLTVAAPDADFGADVVIEILVGGMVVGSETLEFPSEFEPGGAITCAVTCAGECGSIFGDGQCIACNCVYPITLNTLFDLFPDDVVRVTIVPAAGAAPEILTDDDSLEVVFAATVDRMIICHNAQTICVSARAIDAHLAHGDTLGACQ